MRSKEISISIFSAISIGTLGYLAIGDWWGILAMLSGIPIYLAVDVLFKRLTERVSNNIDIYFDKGIWLNDDYTNRTISVRFDMVNHTRVCLKALSGQLSLFIGDSATDE